MKMKNEKESSKVDIENNANVEDEFALEPHQSHSSKCKKAAVAVLITVVLALGIALPLSMTNHKSGKAKGGNTDASSSSKTNANPFNGMPIATSLSDNDAIIKKQSIFGNNECPPGEGMFKFTLYTDYYGYESRWELLSNFDGIVIASGPPLNTNYADETRYMGRMCLEAGEYILKMMDNGGDGVCCDWGEGWWKAEVNGEVVAENTENDKFKEKDYAFVIPDGNGGNGNGDEDVDMLRFQPWSELDSTTKAALRELGYDATSWNNHGTNPIEAKGWWELTAEQTSSGTQAGFDEDSWDCSNHHYESYDWFELEEVDVADSFITLGWSSSSWNGESPPPASDDKFWAELTDEEQDAANDICYFQENWDI